MNGIKKAVLFTVCALLSANVLIGCNNQSGGDNNQNQPPVINYPVGAEMSYRNGLVGSEYVDYNSDLFYYNELRTEAADPHVIYNSSKDASDSYDLIAQSYQYKNGNEWDWINGWSQARFEQEFGTKEEWLEKYSDKFYMTCSRGFTPSEEAAQEFDCTYAAFRIFQSTDLVDWSMCGAIEGAGLAANDQKEWWRDHQWAPEFYRDPATGLYFLYYSMSAKWGSDSGLIPNVWGATTDSTLTNMQLSCAVSPTIEGPYKLITTEQYYEYRAAKNENGEVIVGEQLLQSPDFDGDGRADASYREIYDRDGKTVIAYRSDDGRYFTTYGYEITKNTPPFNIGYYYPRLVSDRALADEFIRQLHVTEYEGFEESTLDNCVFTAIDAHMFTDPVSGEIYMYFSRTTDHNRRYDYVGSIWGIKMRDPITPDWDTLTPLVYPGKTTIYHEEGNPFGVLSEDGEREGSVNEGPAVVYHNGKYYMTYSPWGAASDDYSVMVAVSDSPLGEYVKPGEDYTPVLGRGKEFNDYMAGTGHHCFLTVGDELLAIYHAQKSASNNDDFITGGFLERCIAFDRVVFAYEEELGYDMMFGNGPSYNLQPLPEMISGYENVAKSAMVTGDGTIGEAKFLSDGLVTSHPTARKYEYGAISGKMKMTFKWNSPVNVRAVLVYNAGDIEYAFNKIDYIQFKLSRKPSWYNLSEYNGYLYVKDVMINPNDVRAESDVMVKAGAAIAEFAEITVTEMTIGLTASEDNNVSGWQSEVHVSEVYVIGQGGNA